MNLVFLRKSNVLLLLIVTVIYSCSSVQIEEKPKQSFKELKLWYTAPAADWNEALPIGNGRLGAMVYGNPKNENIQLNENTLWAGGPHRNENPNGKESLSEVRALIFQENYKEAHDIANENFISKKSRNFLFFF